jgi:hypothetical protein
MTKPFKFYISNSLTLETFGADTLPQAQEILNAIIASGRIPSADSAESMPEIYTLAEIKELFDGDDEFDLGGFADNTHLNKYIQPTRG